MTEEETMDAPRTTYWHRLIDGTRPIGSQTEHYWRWPIAFHVRPRLLGVSMHGIRDGVVRRRHGFPDLAVRSFLWVGPVGIEFGWRRQRFEDWRFRRSMRRSEFES